ncbi:MAG: DUF4190 domain-containing protein [Aeromicrobium sp.]
MSDTTPPPGPPSGPEHQPNWGSAYPPPPGAGYPPPGYGYPQYVAAPKHAKATTAMVLGIVSVAAGLMCYLPLLLAPFAWFTGSKAVRDIDESRGALGGRGEATAGKVLGIIGTVLLALGLAMIALFVVLSLTVDSFWDDFWTGFEEA